MKKLHLFLSALALLAFVACGDDENEYNIGGKTGSQTTGYATPEIAKYNLEFPALKGGNSVVIVHNGYYNDKLGLSGYNYSVEWDTQIRAQRWSCYQMYNDNYKTGTKVDRYYKKPAGSLTSDSQYPNDPELPAEYQFIVDPYWSSNFDHGHICPSADRQRSTEANYQTFFLTNMQPQNNDFNAGIWADMETKVRDWADDFDTLFVCKGGTIDKPGHILEYVCGNSHQSTRVNQNHIPVPKYFFMAVLGKKENKDKTTYKATGFWIAQNDHKSTKIKDYAVTIQTLQQNTGLDFFCNLPDDIEKQVENVSQSKMESEWVWYD